MSFEPNSPTTQAVIPKLFSFAVSLWKAAKLTHAHLKESAGSPGVQVGHLKDFVASNRLHERTLRHVEFYWKSDAKIDL